MNDYTVYKGNTYTDKPRLFVAKPKSILQKLTTNDAQRSSKVPCTQNLQTELGFPLQVLQTPNRKYKYINS